VSVPSVVLVVSTGRCGTQFAEHYLRAAGGARWRVEHEPVGPAYAPRRSLRHGAWHDLLPELTTVQAHVQSVDDTLARGQHYAETGWPLFSWVPYFIERYGDAVTLVHLVRDPVRFAFSLAAHGFYDAAARDDDFTQLAALEPSDRGVRLREAQTFWPQMNAVEKSLLQWYEINAYAEELKLRYPGRWLSLRADALFAQPRALLEGLVALRPALADDLSLDTPPPSVVDEYPLRLKTWVDGVRVPQPVAELAASYGFDLSRIDMAALHARFAP
jgi:hypothetical protein